MRTTFKPSRAIIAALTIVYILAALIQLINGTMVGTTERSAAIVGSIIAATILMVSLGASRFGELRVASWFVTFGAVIVGTEHVMWPIRNVRMVGDPHARLHFFMAGIFTFIGLVVLAALAGKLLREARRAGWHAVAFALIVGGVFELVSGGSWYPKGMPLFQVLGLRASGWGWQWLYLYVLAWMSALILSYRPIFGRQKETT